MSECGSSFQSFSKQKVTFSSQKGDKCDSYHYIVENTGVTREKQAAVEDTEAAYSTEEGGGLWPPVAIVFHESLWQPSPHRTLLKKERLLKESSENESGPPRLHLEQVHKQKTKNSQCWGRKQLAWIATWDTREGSRENHICPLSHIVWGLETLP